MKRQLENFYFNLGFGTKQKLYKVRGLTKEKRTWEAFIELPETKRVFELRKMSKKDIDEFERGFKHKPSDDSDN